MEDLNINTAAVWFYLYRQAGKPYGDCATGFKLWVDLQIAEFEKTAQYYVADVRTQ
jgi:hypothetical protein